MDDVNWRLDQETRLEIIDAAGCSYVNWAARAVSLSLQDDGGRTLKSSAANVRKQKLRHKPCHRHRVAERRTR